MSQPLQVLSSSVPALARGGGRRQTRGRERTGRRAASRRLVLSLPHPLPNSHLACPAAAQAPRQGCSATRMWMPGRGCPARRTAGWRRTWREKYEWRGLGPVVCFGSLARSRRSPRLCHLSCAHVLFLVPFHLSLRCPWSTTPTSLMPTSRPRASSAACRRGGALMMFVFDLLSVLSFSPSRSHSRPPHFPRHPDHRKKTDMIAVLEAADGGKKGGRKVSG